MKRTKIFVTIGAILGSTAFLLLGHFDNSGRSEGLDISGVIIMLFGGAFVGGMLGFVIAKVDTKPQAKASQRKSRRKLDPKKQLVTETIGAMGLIALPLYRLINMPQEASPRGYGALIGGIVGVLLVMPLRAYWLLKKQPAENQSEQEPV